MESEGEAKRNPEWELSKENIQPIKQGRKLSKLNQILHPKDEQSMKSIQEERQVFETELRTFSGDDLLDPWYRYIGWVEQTYAKGGKEGNVHVLIEKCITKFKDNKDVHNDLRFLDIWLKYAALSSQPLDIYDFMYKQGLCTQQGGLYEAWAWHLEMADSFKKAEAVFVKGVAALTDPCEKELLVRKQKRFQVRVIRRIKGEQIPDEEVEEEQRSALGLLKSRHGKVGSVRVGSVKLGGPGVVSSKQPLKQNNGQAGSFPIFQDENGSSVSGVGKSQGGRSVLPGSRSERKENEMSASQWGKAKGVSKGSNVPLSKISQHSQPATFTVHQDENLAQPNITPRKLVAGETNVLTARKKDSEVAGTVHCPVALFEAPDPSKRSMYCKDKVYQGATEFSFEELRAVKWRVKEKSRLEMESIEDKKKELLEMEAKLKEQQEAMSRQMAEFQKMLTGGVAGLHVGMAGMTPGMPVMAPGMTGTGLGMTGMAPGSVSVPDVKLSRPRLSSDSRDDSYPSLHRKISSADDTDSLISANPTGLRMSATQSPLSHHTSMPSPTVNTKEAMAAMQEMWSNTLAVEDSPAQEISIYKDKPSSAPFQIFSDEPSQSTHHQPIKKSRATLFNQDYKENCLVDQENCPPSVYSQPLRGSRITTGVLTEASNVDFVPLDEQEKLLDEDEIRQEDEFSKPPKPQMCNQTMALPNEADFERMAMMNSTPFTGRPFMTEADDENTCAVDLVYRSMGPPTIPIQPAEHNLLSPIVETSREYYKSSSSSSGGETLGKTTLGKSHWGNTAGSSLHTTGQSLAKTPGQSLAKTPGQATLGCSSASGYFGDASSLSGTKSVMKTKANIIPYSQRMEIVEDKDDEDDEPTGMFSDMMAEFQQNLAVPEANKRNEEQLENSLQVSIIEQGQRDPTHWESRYASSAPNMIGATSNLNMTGAPPALNMTGAHQGLNVTGAPQALNMTEAHQGFNITGAPPALNVTGATAKLHMTGVTPSLNITGAPPTFNITGAAASLNVTGAPPSLNMTGAPPSLNVTGAPPSLNMTGAPPSLNMTGAPPSLNMTGAPPSLNMTGAPPSPNMTGAPTSLNITGAPTSLNITGAPTSLNITGAPPNVAGFSDPTLDFTAAPPELPMTDEDLEMDLEEDPFAPETHERLLSTLSIPLSSRHGYVRSNANLPRVQPKTEVTLGQDVFFVSECKGQGGFATVFAAIKQDTGLDNTITGIDAVLKVQKPANDWEWYMCGEVASRVEPRMRDAFMSTPRNYNFNDGGIFVSYHQKLGSLLDIVNITKKCGLHKSCIEPMAVYFTIEMLAMVESLHKANILHADIKPDNFLLQNIPKPDPHAQSISDLFSNQLHALQLIDFGKSIDLSLLPSGTFFSKVVKTGGLTCTEMREGKKWREQIDIFGLAGTAYCLLFGDYMDVVKVGNMWEVKGSFKRWWTVDLWKQFFSDFVNVEGSDKGNLPDLAAWRSKFQEVFFEKKMANHFERMRQEIGKALYGV